MKSTKSIQEAQRQMRNRQQQPRGPGRPPLPISRNELLDLWARGYSRRGMAIHFGCDQRTIMSRLAKFFPDGLKLSKLPPSMLYYLAMNTNDSRFLVYFLKREGPKIERSGILLMRRQVEREFRQRQKIEAEERAREMSAAAEASEKGRKQS